MVKSINSLPDDYGGICTCVVNDKEPLVVARNVILLLITATMPPTEAAELCLHVWYSARLTNQMSDTMTAHVRPLIADIVAKTSQKGSNVLLNKTWTFGRQKISACLTKTQWAFLLNVLDAKHPASNTEQSRRFVMLNNNRIDYRERQLFNAPGARRVCYQKMRETGILLPFGACLNSFTVANP